MWAALPRLADYGAASPLHTHSRGFWEQVPRILMLARLDPRCGVGLRI